MTISEMLEIKRELGLTNEEISEVSGVPLGTLQKLLSGKTTAPRKATVQALERFFTDAPLHYAALPRETAAASRLAEPAAPYRAKKQGEYTVEDYYALPDERRVELIDGVFYDMAAPSILHQKLLGELHLQFEDCAAHCGKECDVLLSPCDVQLDMDNKTMLQPDLFVVCRDYERTAHAFGGAPDLVIEILSPSTRDKDIMVKTKKYREAGVREYWLVDPANRIVICWDFTAENYRPEVFPFDSQIPVHISEGKCHIDFAKIHNRLKKYF